MRTLSANLTAAQRAALGEPYVAVTVENIVGSLRRLDFTQLDATSNTIARHGVAVAADASVTRIRSDGAGGLFRQRWTSGAWTSWTTQQTGKGNQCAVAAQGTRVVIVYVDLAGTGIKYIESTDSGATFGAETVVVTAAFAVLGLAVAYKSSGGDLAVSWITSATLGIIKRTSGTFGASSNSGITVSSLNGLAMCYGADWDIALTGVEATSLRRTLWTIAHGDGFDLAAGTWGSLNPQQQAETNSSVAFSAPAIVYTDGYHLTYVEADTFTGGNTRTYRTTLHQSASFVAGANMMSAPVPVNYAGAEGLALCAEASGTGYYYETAPNIVTRAPQSQSLATLTNDVLAIAIDERSDRTSGYVDIDNAGGAYAGPPAPIVLGNRINIGWGYRTASGLETSAMADLYLASYEYRHSLSPGGASTLRLYVEGGWDLLRRNRQRTQVVHTGAETYAQILVRVMSRAGLNLVNSAASSRSTTVTPKFTIQPQTSGYEAAHQVLSFLADRVRMTPLGCVLTEPLAADATTYTYGTTHPLLSARVVGAPAPVSQAQAYGAAAFGEAIDYASAAVGVGTQEQSRDLNSASGATAAATATAHLRQRAMDSDAGELVVPPNVGQEAARPRRHHRPQHQRGRRQAARAGHRVALRPPPRPVRADAHTGGSMTAPKPQRPHRGHQATWWCPACTAENNEPFNFCWACKQDRRQQGAP